MVSAKDYNNRRRPSTRRSFEDKDDPLFGTVLKEPEIPDADYGRDDIFVGWSKGSRDHYENFKEAKINEYNSRSTQAIKDSLYMFRKKFEEYSQETLDEIDPLLLDQGSASVSFHAGERGAGKSFYLRGYGNRSAKAGILTIHIDPAHEYWTNNKKGGAKPSTLNKSAGLRRGEDAQRIETAVLMPTFIRMARKKADLGFDGQKWTVPFQFGFDDLDQTDLSYLLLKDVNRNSDEKKFQDFQKFISELSKAIEDGGVSSFQDLMDLADKMQEQGRFKYEERHQDIKDTIEMYLEWDFLGDKKLEDQDLSQFIDDESDLENIDSWEEFITEVNCITLSLEDDDECPGHLEMKQFYIALLIKKVRSLAKGSSDFDSPVNWVIDEIHRFVDSDDYDDREKAPLAHWEIRKIIKEDRKIGFRVAMASQQVKDIPEDNFLKQTDHMFIPMNMDSEDRRYLLQLYDIYSQADPSRDKWKTIFDALNEFEWFYMRKKTKSWQLLIPPAPLARHLAE